MPKKELEIITVKGVENDNKVALWDKDERHPNGVEAFVVNDGKAYEVAKTNEVKRALGEGRITTEVGDAELYEAVPQGESRSPRGYGGRQGNPQQPQAQSRDVNWASKASRGGQQAPELRDATETEEENAGLTEPVEKQTAKVPEQGGIRKGARP